MSLPKVAKIVVDRPVEGPFDYAVGEKWRARIKVGQRVLVKFTNRQMVGFVVGLSQTTRIKRLNEILSILDDDPVLDPKALALTKQFSVYYGCSWGEAIGTYLPAVLRKTTPSHLTKNSESFNEEMDISQRKFILWHDQGSEYKWTFVMEKLAKVIAQRRQVIFLVPDSAFIVTIRKRLTSLSEIKLCLWDKPLATRKDLSLWAAMKNGEIDIVLGVRSAIFAPVPRLGLIVVYDEEHDFYKQEQSPHYHVRQVSQIRARIEGAEVCFLSAVPSVEIWKEAQKKNWQKITFKSPLRASIQLIDMTNYNPRKTSILSFPLQSKIEEYLRAKKRIVLFINRRGFASLTRCNQCGFTVRCQRCDVNMTYLRSKNCMVCRCCHFQSAPPRTCPSCQGNYMRSMGKGVERLRQEAARLYPTAKVSFYDRDSPVFPAESDIVIATQSIMRMKQQIRFNLSAILHFDAQLYHMDFRCAHKAFALWVHLYRMTTEHMIVQTDMPDNEIIRAGYHMDFDRFYRQELRHRKELGFPPYKHLVALIIRGPKEEEVFDYSQKIFNHLQQESPKEIELSDPHPDTQPKLRDKYRFSILLKGSSVKNILGFLKTSLKKLRKKKGIILTIDVDY